MPWYIGGGEVTDAEEPGNFWVVVHNKSITKLWEDIDEYMKKEVPSDCEVRIGQVNPGLAPGSYLIEYGIMDDGTFQWHINLTVIKSSHDEHSKNFEWKGHFSS